MWLLETKTGHLRNIAHPRCEKRPYAILSHVWSTEEQTFQEVSDLVHQSWASTQSSAPSCILPSLSWKIRNFCEYVYADGYEIAWIDTCCIDKSSSAELSEAINSMFEWYRAAAICYVYLADVDSEDDPYTPLSHFRRSRWHTRMWTLQELLAPSLVVFLSKDWQPLGTKTSLASVIEAVVGIPRGVLLARTPLASVSVAQRMSWAARRQATRVEDEAYALMGLFGVTMTTIYGEGRNAFTRLQEEILKHIPDQSIFLWGPVLNAPSVPKILPFDSTLNSGEYRHERALLASRPADFKNSGSIRTHSPMTLMKYLANTSVRNVSAHSIPDYTITSYGIRTRLPVYVARSSRDSPIRMAILACSFDDNDFVGLLLEQDNQWVEDGYLVGAIALDEEALHSARRLPGSSILHRAVRISHDDLASLGAPTVTDIHIFTQRCSEASAPQPQLLREPDWMDPTSYTYRVILPAWRRALLVSEGYTVASQVVERGRRAGHAYVFALQPTNASEHFPAIHVWIGPCHCVSSLNDPTHWRSPLMSVKVSTSVMSLIPSTTSHITSALPVVHRPPRSLQLETHPIAPPGEVPEDIEVLNPGPPEWHAHDDPRHITPFSWGYDQFAGETAISRKFSCRGPDGAIAEVQVTLDHPPDISNPWSQIYTVGLSIILLAGKKRVQNAQGGWADERRSSSQVYLRTWAYDRQAGRFFVCKREPLPMKTSGGAYSSPEPESMGRQNLHRPHDIC